MSAIKRLNRELKDLEREPPAEVRRLRNNVGASRCSQLSAASALQVQLAMTCFNGKQLWPVCRSNLASAVLMYLLYLRQVQRTARMKVECSSFPSPFLQTTLTSHLA